MFGPSSFCFGRKKPTAFRFPPGEESSIFVGSFLPFNRKPTSLGFAVGIRGNFAHLFLPKQLKTKAPLSKGSWRAAPERFVPQLRFTKEP